jgi:hypothetical protein
MWHWDFSHTGQLYRAFIHNITDVLSHLHAVGILCHLFLHVWECWLVGIICHTLFSPPTQFQPYVIFKKMKNNFFETCVEVFLIGMKA